MTKSQATAKLEDTTPVWGAVWGLAVGVAALVTAEFMPVSLLTPMAKAIGISEGLAGQTISATAVVAIVTSIFLSSIVRDADRRLVMIGFSALMVVSCILVAAATSFWMLIVARVFLGMALGGFWSMSTSVAMRLVPGKDVAKAFAIIFGGVSVSNVVSGPLGSLLESAVGWRTVFLLCGAFGAIALMWQIATLPSLPAGPRARLSILWDVFRRPEVTVGMVCVGLTFAGHIAFFTYMRPFLENVTGIGGVTFSAVFLAFGIANFLGNSISGTIVGKNLRATLAMIAATMFVAAIVLVLLGANLWVAAACVTFWGFAFGFIPVGWSTWLTRTIRDEAEVGGGIYVACIQAGLLAGAGLGGLLLDAAGTLATFIFAGAIMLVSAVLIFTRIRQ